MEARARRFLPQSLCLGSFFAAMCGDVGMWGCCIVCWCCCAGSIFFCRDIVEVEPGLNTCDMVLMAGKVVLDESSLTGESMPVAKDAIENRNEKFTLYSHKKAIILVFHQKCTRSNSCCGTRECV